MPEIQSMTKAMTNVFPKSTGKITLLSKESVNLICQPKLQTPPQKKHNEEKGVNKSFTHIKHIYYGSH